MGWTTRLRRYDTLLRAVRAQEDQRLSDDEAEALAVNAAREVLRLAEERRLGPGGGFALPEPDPAPAYRCGRCGGPVTADEIAAGGPLRVRCAAGCGGRE